ncbi:TOX high mobility group box family member 3-like [Conger conger]|uniref:TOX high mobility group box family member 3-like n=1 Tax=Conger conger TaxID=82655 RepID=UPI002A5AA9CE|nr:TOX high mobility group box family member 3-like [Conger conger]
MDVRLYPSASGNPIPGDPSNLSFHHCLGYFDYNKFGNHNSYMNMAEANGALLPAEDHTFHTPSLGDEEFEIPPITPPPEVEGSPFPGLLDPPSPQEGPFTPQFPPQSLELPSITIPRNRGDQEDPLLRSSLPMNIGQARLHQSHPSPSAVSGSSAMTTTNQSQLSVQLGLNVIGPNISHTSPSPPASKSATPSPSSSTNEEDPDDGTRATGEKRPPPDPGRKPKTPKKKKKNRDPNEPQKPVSAYALFFRDTQAAIKAQNPSASFGEVSKVVASMWDGLRDEQKQLYKSKTEAAKKEYLKALAVYRASLVSKAAADSVEVHSMRSVQQTLTSARLSPSLLLPPHPPSTAPALQQALPRSLAPRMRLPGGAGTQGLPVGGPSRPMGMGGALGMGQQTTQPAQHHQLQQQHLQHHHLQQQLHHQQLQQQMQHQHFQQLQQHQLQQHHLQQQQQRQQMQQHHLQLQHIQLQQLHQQQMQQLQQQHPSQCSPGTPQSASHRPRSQHHLQAQIQAPAPAPAPAQTLSQVSIY